MVVLIPSYEPTDQLIKIIKQIQETTDFRILIVDDGSSEKYQNIFVDIEALGCIIIHHNENKGKGEALKTGFNFLMSQGIIESVICADSDGQHHIQDIIKIAEHIDETRFEMVIGVRKFKGEIPLKSKFGNILTAVLFSKVTKIRIVDTQTGLRGYPFSMIPWLVSIEGKRFEYELNLLLKSREADIRIKQIPITTIYENDNKGTHFHPIKDSVMIYMSLLKFSLSSFVAGILDFVLLFVFQSLTNSLFFGVVLARGVSSIFNYSVNKYMVFKNKTLSNTQSAPKYFGLVIMIMLLNYLMLAFMSEVLLIPSLIAKILTELILFCISYNAQKKIVFRSRKKMRSIDKSNNAYFTAKKSNDYLKANKKQPFSNLMISKSNIKK